MLTTLLLTWTAAAAELPEPMGPPLPAEWARDGGGKGGKGSGKGGKGGGKGPKGGGKGGGKGDGKRGKDEPHWETDWYVLPAAGVNVVGNGTSSSAIASVGGTAGINYLYQDKGWPKWGGTSRAGLTQSFGSDGSQGTDVRLGSFFGPHWKYAAIEAGPDLFWNRWSVPGFQLDPTFGVDVPITASAGAGALSGFVGIAPTWVSNPDRRVDWSEVDAFGFGHEFSWFAGASVRAGSLIVSASYTKRITAAGPQQGFGVSADISKVITGGSKR